MNILCIADSLGLPRDGVKIEDTWFYKLCHSFPQHHFIDRFERGMLTSRLIESEDFSNPEDIYGSVYRPRDGMPMRDPLSGD